MPILGLKIGRSAMKQDARKSGWDASLFDGYLAADEALGADSFSSSADYLELGRTTEEPGLGNGLAGPEAEARVCGARCGSTWVKPWKNRNRPVLEDEWGCTAKCLHSIVSGAIRREVRDGTDDGEVAPHRHRVPLGLVLLAQGWITHPQLQMALENQRKTGHGRIGDWLVQTCALDHHRVTRALGMQWNCPVFTRDGFTPASMALVMPKRFMMEFGVVPLRMVARRLLYLASESNMDPATALAIEQMSGLKVESGLLDDLQFAQVRDAVLATEGVPLMVSSAKDADELAVQMTRKLHQEMPIASRLVRVHQYFWLRMWLESGAFSGVGTQPASKDDVRDFLFTIAKAA